MTDHPNPAASAVELAVYAPIGFALEAKRLLPSFIERGRQQVTMARTVGQFAVTHGQAVAGQRLARAQAQAEAVLAEFGLAGTDVAEPVAPAAAPEADAVAAPSAPAPAADPSELPIAGYDALAASQVIPRLEGLTPDELEAVRAYETATRGR
ncbi:MAG: hypothetical protein KDA97_07980, partial [Acidimicrobiales bacterium]|nr:hypothetical protein [Acidimicrobiales bacterium]